MTELARAKRALAEKISEFEEQTALLQTESNEAWREHRNAYNRLSGHLASRKRVLESAATDVATAEKAEIGRQNELPG